MAATERLDRALIAELVRRAVDEDVGVGGDITSNAIVDPAARGRGILLAKQPLVVAGLDVAAEVFWRLDPEVDVAIERGDGTLCEAGEVIAAVSGRAARLLTAERTALNFLQRLSGVATLARKFVDASRGSIVVLDTRKTTPGLRALEKYAVRVGGAANHRMGLSSGILIKDNHVRLAGGVAEAFRRMKAAGHALPIEIEVQTLEEADEALEAGAQRLLVDNMATEDIAEVVRRSRGRALVEISGGVTLSRIPELAATGADFVSVGALTHSAPAADISFEVVPA
ncbi:MAG: carboxylating nicotinate-nucleotide diphosphorylase [Vicinamibacterales bacterium]